MHRLRDGDRGRRREAVAAAAQHWLLVRGRGDRPLDARVDVRELRAHSSSRRPSVAVGELAILYAAVWQCVFALAEIAGLPEHDPTRERWAWRFPIRWIVAVGDLHEAPAAEEAGIWPQSLWRHSHIRLTPGQFAAARELVEAVARRQGPTGRRPTARRESGRRAE